MGKIRLINCVFLRGPSYVNFTLILKTILDIYCPFI